MERGGAAVMRVRILGRVKMCEMDGGSFIFGMILAKPIEKLVFLILAKIFYFLKNLRR